VNNGTYNQLIHKQCTTPVNRASVDVRRRQQYIARTWTNDFAHIWNHNQISLLLFKVQTPRIHGGILRERKINKPGTPVVEKPTSEAQRESKYAVPRGSAGHGRRKTYKQDGGARALGLRTNDFVRPVDEVRPSVQLAPTFRLVVTEGLIPN
jgi:hypothetical protein